MPFKQHNRQYDLVVFGATGYTGQFTAEHIATHLPTNLKWALAGRSREKLEAVANECKKLNRDRVPPGIEICNLNDADLAALAKKTFVLITTVGPYGKYGEHAFRACAEAGTHYLDVTGEVPFVARMIKKYEGVAKANGSLMFPQIGIESTPSDLITWTLASVLRSELNAPTRDVTLSIHALSSVPSGGTLATALGMFEHFSLKEVKDSHKPFALSPVPNPNPPKRKSSLISKLIGLRRVHNLGLLTTSVAGGTDGAIVERSWGLLSSIPSRKSEFYGPNFSWRQYFRPRNWYAGIGLHLGLSIAGLLLVTVPYFGRFIQRFVYQPGEGPTREDASKEEIEYHGIANADLAVDPGRQAFCRAWFRGGGMYYLTGIFLAQAASTILEEDLELDGGVYTPACLGQGFVDRLDGAGFKFETKMIEA